ncbi:MULTISPECIES: hypothetical protein [Geobacter]|uniref:hypothetical protein n=1 Tax=Geobacter TaxID=28231 RepID=UPI0025746A63|nr:hypothetical protein [Geobacter sulfurreducens]BEH11840.1 hypothetical protein GSUET_34520 [Geobacter sulfurreducens subsp. ethanolicus]BET59703.1 hypothetical protein GEO60473_27430 [Geobacter sp. 60473]
MPTTAKQLDISALPPSSRRELLDFYQFLLERPKHVKKVRTEKRSFSDLCGRLSWKGDAVEAQRSMRDEW